MRSDGKFKKISLTLRFFRLIQEVFFGKLNPSSSAVIEKHFCQLVSKGLKIGALTYENAKVIELAAHRLGISKKPSITQLIDSIAENFFENLYPPHLSENPSTTLNPLIHSIANFATPFLQDQSNQVSKEKISDTPHSQTDKKSNPEKNPEKNPESNRLDNLDPAPPLIVSSKDNPPEVPLDKEVKQDPKPRVVENALPESSPKRSPSFSKYLKGSALVVSSAIAAFTYFKFFGPSNSKIDPNEVNSAISAPQNLNLVCPVSEQPKFDPYSLLPPKKILQEPLFRKIVYIPKAPEVAPNPEISPPVTPKSYVNIFSNGIKVFAAFLVGAAGYKFFKSKVSPEERKYSPISSAKKVAENVLSGIAQNPNSLIQLSPEIISKSKRKIIHTFTSNWPDFISVCVPSERNRMSALFNNFARPEISEVVMATLAEATNENPVDIPNEFPQFLEKLFIATKNDLGKQYKFWEMDYWDRVKAISSKFQYILSSKNDVIRQQAVTLFQKVFNEIEFIVIVKGIIKTASTVYENGILNSKEIDQNNVNVNFLKHLIDIEEKNYIEDTFSKLHHKQKLDVLNENKMLIDLNEAMNEEFIIKNEIYPLVLSKFEEFVKSDKKNSEIPITISSFEENICRIAETPIFDLDFLETLLYAKIDVSNLYVHLIHNLESDIAIKSKREQKKLKEQELRDERKYQSFNELIIKKPELIFRNPKGNKSYIEQIIKLALDQSYPSSANIFLEILNNNFNNEVLKSVYRSFLRPDISKDLAELFLKHGMDINFKNTRGNTCLSIALNNSNYELAAFLIEKGIIVSEDDKTAIKSKLSFLEKQVTDLTDKLNFLKEQKDLLNQYEGFLEKNDILKNKKEKSEADLSALKNQVDALNKVKISNERKSLEYENEIDIDSKLKFFDNYFSLPNNFEEGMKNYNLHIQRKKINSKLMESSYIAIDLNYKSIEDLKKIQSMLK